MKILHSTLLFISCFALPSYVAKGQTSNVHEEPSVYTIKPVQPKVPFLTSLINQTNHLYIFPKDSLLAVVNTKDIIRKEELINLNPKAKSRLVLGHALISKPD